MLQATGKQGDRSVALALSPEDCTLLFRNERDLWDMEKFASVEECYQAAEQRYGVSRDAWHPGEFTVADLMQAYATDAWAMARDRFQTDLDFSEESIAKVEQILGKMYDARPTGLRKLLTGKRYEQQVQILARMWGAYIGEVVRRHVGGQWTFDDRLEAGQKVVALQWDDENMCFPLAKVHKRLTNGPEDSVASFYSVLVETRKDKAAITKV